MQNYIEIKTRTSLFKHYMYFDTDDYELIRTSIEKPVYKEKIRLRSYGIPNMDDSVFLEIKKKFEGVGNKRRITLKLREFNDYYLYHKVPNVNKQIFKEIDYIMKSKDYIDNFIKMVPVC